MPRYLPALPPAAATLRTAPRPAHTCLLPLPAMPAATLLFFFFFFFFFCAGIGALSRLSPLVSHIRPPAFAAHCRVGCGSFVRTDMDVCLARLWTFYRHRCRWRLTLIAFPSWHVPFLLGYAYRHAGISVRTGRVSARRALCTAYSAAVPRDVGRHISPRKRSCKTDGG